MTSLEIKHALLSHYRFKRQYICASECMDNDVMVIANKGIIEIEVKVNKYDLWKGEAKKSKHRWYKGTNYQSFIPNLFYVCVPKELEEEAVKWTESMNNKYGVLGCHERTFFPYLIYTIKRAKKLHNNFNKNLEHSIMRRVCCENINLIGRLLNEGNNSRK